MASSNTKGNSFTKNVSIVSSTKESLTGSKASKIRPFVFRNDITKFFNYEPQPEYLPQ